MTTGKTIALTKLIFVGKVMSLLFNKMSRLIIGEGNGNPLQYSCLENLMDGRAWWAAVSRVTESDTTEATQQQQQQQQQQDCKEIQAVHPKGNQSWILIGRTDAEAETPILWSPDAKNWLIWKDPDAGKDWRWKEKGMTEDEMVGWHQQLGGHEFE